MTNPDAGRKIIRKLPDRPLIGERYSNAGSVYEVLSLNTEGDTQAQRWLVLHCPWPGPVRDAGRQH